MKTKQAPAGAFGAGQSQARDDRVAWREYLQSLAAPPVASEADDVMLSATELLQLLAKSGPPDPYADLVGDDWGPRADSPENVYPTFIPDASARWAGREAGLSDAAGLEDIYGDRDARAWGPVLQAAY